MKLFTVLPFLVISQGTAFQTRCCPGRIRFCPSCTSMDEDVTCRALSRRGVSMQSTIQRQEFCAVFGLPATSKRAASILLGASLFLSVPPGVAADHYGGSSPPPDALVLMGEYSDLDEDGKTFRFLGTDEGSIVDDAGVSRGWSPGEIQKCPLGTEERLDGNVMLQLPGLQLSNGYGVDKGVWESPINSVIDPNIQFKAVDGITRSHDDGTTGILKETKKPLSTVIGEWIFLAYIGFSTLAGVKGVWDKIQEKKNRAL